MKVQEVIRAMEDWAPPGLAYGWDRCGLDIGEPGAKVAKALVTLTVTRAAFAAAKRAKAELIVAHHPAIWEPLTALRTDDPVASLCLDIAGAGMACYSAHTNLDVVPDGVNGILADRLDLHDRAPLLPVPHAGFIKLVTFVPETHLATVRVAVSEAGAGTIGDYTYCTFSAPGVGTFLPGTGAKPFSGKRHIINEEPEQRFEILVPKARLSAVLKALLNAHPYEEPAYDLVPLENTDSTISLGLRGTLKRAVSLDTFAARVRANLEIAHVRVVGNPKRKIRQVAVLGGAGGGSIASMPDDLDAVVTGDVKYHEALDAEARGIAIIDAGHHGTEKWIVPAIAARLRAALPELRVATYMEPDIFRAITR